MLEFFTITVLIQFIAFNGLEVLSDRVRVFAPVWNFYYMSSLSKLSVFFLSFLLNRLFFSMTICKSKTFS